MSKKRAVELSDRQLELLDEPPSTAKSKYEASRKQTTVDQDNSKLSMVESLFSQLKLKALKMSKTPFPTFWIMKIMKLFYSSHRKNPLTCYFLTMFEVIDKYQN
jgi:hypothetical protein